MDATACGGLVIYPAGNPRAPRPDRNSCVCVCASTEYTHSRKKSLNTGRLFNFSFFCYAPLILCMRETRYPGGDNNTPCTG